MWWIKSAVITLSIDHITKSSQIVDFCPGIWSFFCSGLWQVVSVLSYCFKSRSKLIIYVLMLSQNFHKMATFLNWLKRPHYNYWWQGIHKLNPLNVYKFSELKNFFRNKSHDIHYILYIYWYQRLSPFTLHHPLIILKAEK